MQQMIRIDGALLDDVMTAIRQADPMLGRHMDAQTTPYARARVASEIALREGLRALEWRYDPGDACPTCGPDGGE